MTPRTAPGQSNRTVLWNALQAEDVDAVKAALDAGADPNGGYGGWLPLGRALRHSAPAMAVALIESGARLDGQEQNRSLVVMAVGRPDGEPVLAAMLARGAPASYEALSTAAQMGHGWAVEALLAAGAPLAPEIVDQRLPRPIPPLARWSEKAQGAPPAVLVERSFAHALSDEVAELFALEIVKDKCMIALQRFVTHARLSEGGKNKLLYHCVQRTWQEGVDHLLEITYCDPTQENPHHQPVLLAFPYWLRQGRQRHCGWRMLHRLMAYGYTPERTHYPFHFADSDRSAPGSVPNGFELLKQAPADTRGKLLRILAAQGLSPVFVTKDSATSIAHCLIDLNEWSLLPQIKRLWPRTDWDQSGLPSLLSCWACAHEAVASPVPLSPSPQETLDAVVELPGLDATKCDRHGHGALRYLLDRNHPNQSFLNGKRMHASTVLDTLTRRLIEMGVDPFRPDEAGVDDFTYAHELRLPEGMREQWAEAAMERQTAAASPKGRRGPRL